MGAPWEVKKSLFIAALMATVARAALAADAPPTSPTDGAVDPAPKAWPDAVQQLSPSVPLDPKSRHGIALVHRWARRPVMPAPGPRGEVRFIYGATQDTVVCAPLRVCDITLQPGEIVQNVNLGDSTMWDCPPGISGSGAAQVTHLLCKPADAGLDTTLVILTNRRDYSVRLISTRGEYMPRVAWDYPSDQALSWSTYQESVGAQGGSMIPRSDGAAIHYDISGDSPPWRPVQVWSDGKKTYISFPPAMAYGKAPVLERLP
jgi:type IV secretion system protein TrbG